jgi:uroporphyrinogen decarboxylase
MAPYLKEIVDLTHKYRKLYFKHLDGNTYAILDSLINICGIDAYHAIEPSAGMDIEKVKKMYGDRITVIGNIDCGDILVNWEPERIKDEVKRIIRTVSPGGGHILSSSNAIHSGIPIENFLAYINTAKEYGAYPIPH